MSGSRTLFFPAKNKRLSKIISIESPSKAKESVRRLKEDGLTLKEKRAAILAANRSKAMLSRKDLSSKERKLERLQAKKREFKSEIRPARQTSRVFVKTVSKAGKSIGVQTKKDLRKAGKKLRREIEEDTDSVFGVKRKKSGVAKRLR